jgi:hypothetical protein
MQSHSDDRLTATATVTFSDSASEVEASLDKAVLEDVVVLISNEQNKLATDFLDHGDLARCRETLRSNERFLNENAEKLDSPRLWFYGDANRAQADEVSSNGIRARKVMRELQLQTDTQQKVDN